MRSTCCTAEYHLGVVVKSATKSNTVAARHPCQRDQPRHDRDPNTAPLLADPPERVQKVVLDRIPLGRHGQPEDVVNAAIFLASDESSWISGTNIVVDGGGSVLG